jgi:hypothetical protein
MTADRLPPSSMAEPSSELRTALREGDPVRVRAALVEPGGHSDRVGPTLRSIRMNTSLKSPQSASPARSAP